MPPGLKNHYYTRFPLYRIYFMPVLIEFNAGSHRNSELEKNFNH